MESVTLQVPSLKVDAESARKVRKKVA